MSVYNMNKSSEMEASVGDNMAECACKAWPAVGYEFSVHYAMHFDCLLFLRYKYVYHQTQ